MIESSRPREIKGDSRVVLVADGDAQSRHLISTLLHRVGYATSEAGTGAEALELAHRERPALVLLDVHLPEISGYEVCRELRDEFGDSLPIVFVSADRTTPADEVAGLIIGADEYLAKPVRADQLMARVRRLLARSRAGAPRLTAKLTKREQDVLSLLVDGLSQGEIAQRLYVTSRTVGKHIEHILRKLDVHSRTQAVALAIWEGIGRGPPDGGLPGGSI